MSQSAIFKKQHLLYLQRHNEGLYNQNMTFFKIFSTDDSFAKVANDSIGLCCVQGQGHSEGSKFQLIFVQMISSEQLKSYIIMR